jgi:hypothetical protein
MSPSLSIDRASLCDVQKEETEGMDAFYILCETERTRERIKEMNKKTKEKIKNKILML